MKMPFKHLQFLTLGVFLLSSSVFAAANECYSLSELNDFKAMYVSLQNELNYEGKDAYLDKNSQIQLKAHAANAPYPGKEFEAALFSEYQNSLRKIGRLYQNAKFDGDDNFKSNDLLVNFMKAIDDKASAESTEFINKTKIKDVLNALEAASKKKYGNSDKKFVINAGDKYLLEKLLTHAQDRVCSVSKFAETNKGTGLFKADYLQKVKNAPLNLLINTIKNAPLEKDSKISLKDQSPLVDSLVNPDVAVKSAIAEHLNQLSAWVKKVKSKGPKCLAAIQNKGFANKIQNNIQGCNFGHFIETLSQDNVDNLESVLHFINANEKLLNQAAAKAETNLDELKLEGYVGQTFDKLGTQIRCTQLDSSASGEKKLFVRNLPYNEKTNQFDTTSIICKSKSKTLSADACKKQYDLVSDNLGRGLEVKPKKSAAGTTFSVKEDNECSDIAFNAPEKSTLPATEKECLAQSKEGLFFKWNKEANSCSSGTALLNLAQCDSLKNKGFDFKWDKASSQCDAGAPNQGLATLNLEQCQALSKDGFPFKWNASIESCLQGQNVLSAEQKNLAQQQLAKAIQANKTILPTEVEQLKIEQAKLEQEKSELAKAEQAKIDLLKNGHAPKGAQASNSQMKTDDSGKVIDTKSAAIPDQYKHNQDEQSLSKALMKVNSQKPFVNQDQSSALLVTSAEQAKANAEQQKLSKLLLKVGQSEKPSLIVTKDTHITTPALSPEEANKNQQQLAKAIQKADSQTTSLSPAKSSVALSPEEQYKANAEQQKLAKALQKSGADTSATVKPSAPIKSVTLTTTPSKIVTVGTKTTTSSSEPVRPEAQKDYTRNVAQQEPVKAMQKPETADKKDETTPAEEKKPEDAAPEQAKLDCEMNTKEGYDYKYIVESNKCQEKAISRDECAVKKKDGFTYKWDADASLCKEEAAVAAVDPGEAACTLENERLVKEENKDIPGIKVQWNAETKKCEPPPVDGEAKCQADNATWVAEKNDGRPKLKFSWNEDKKTCDDLIKDSDKKKDKDAEGSGEEEEAPTPMKRAPARFVPVNIPSRQIYLMPGMP